MKKPILSNSNFDKNKMSGPAKNRKQRLLKKLAIVCMSFFIVTCLVLSSYQIFAGDTSTNDKKISILKSKNKGKQQNDKKTHRKYNKKHNTPTTVPTSTHTTAPTPTNTAIPTSTHSAIPTSTNTTAPTSPSSGKIDINTQLFNLAWSNTGKFANTIVPASGNNNIVELDCDVDASKVNQYKQQGYQIAGYISVGSWEDWRTDKSNFPTSVFGAPYDGWEGETWFLVSKWKDLMPGMTKRMAKLKEKGFQLVEFDNIEFETGNKSDMIDYALELAKVAKSNSLLPLFKNGADLINQDSRIKDAYSGFIVEEAFKYNETNSFANINKPTWFFEYDSVDKSKVQSWMTNVWYDTSSGWSKIK